MTAVNAEMIDFPANGGTVPGYLARSNFDGDAPGVVVIQEWWGLNAHIKRVTDAFAGAGFVALAPDLYRGQVATEPDEARKLAMALEFPRAMADIQGAVDYLIAQPFVQPKQISVVGFCMGGRLAGLMALDGQNIGAVSAFYGVHELSDADAQKLDVPLLAIYGEMDRNFSADVIRNNQQKLEAAGKAHEVVVYPGAQHAFFNDDRPHIYNKEAADDAWKRTVDWFKKHLA